MHQAVSPSALKACSPGRFTNFSPGASLKAVSPASQYERLESNIGEGAYGKVHKAKDLKTGQIVAIKKAKVTEVDRHVGGIGFTALREIKLMQAVRHPNVMGCLDVFAEAGTPHLVMEFMDGDLKKVINDRSLILSEAHVKCLCQQLLAGLDALHQRWFLHRDVTPGNILVNFTTGIAKLSDFGFARTIGHRDRPLTPMCTTLWYRCPELLYGAKFYGEAVDIWSTGCILAEMFLRKPLFQGRGEFDMMTKIFTLRGSPTEEVWRDVSALPTFLQFSHADKVPMQTVVENCSASGHAMLEDLLQLDPKQRPAADSALRHEFFTTALPTPADPAQLPFVHRTDFMM